MSDLLSVDGFQLITRYLSFSDKLSAELVCKAWKKNMDYSDITTLHISDYSQLPHFKKQFSYSYHVPGLNPPGYRFGSNLCIVDNHRLTALLKLMAAKNAKLTTFSSGGLLSTLCTIDLLETLGNCFPFLENLNLSGCFVRENSIAFISSFKRLKYLNLCYTRFLYSFMNNLIPSPKVSVRLELTNLFNNLPALEHLNICYYDSELPEISIPTLRRLDISHCPLLTRAFMERTAVSCSNLISLELMDIEEFDQKDLIFRRTPNLKRIHLNNLSNSELHQLCFCCPKLEEIVFYSHKNNTPTDLRPLTTLEDLKCLVYNIQFAMLQDVVVDGIGSLKLTHLEFFSTCITDTQLMTLVERSVNIEKLNLSSCRFITMRSLNLLSVKLPKLKEVSVNNYYHRVGNSFLETFGQNGDQIAMISVWCCSVNLKGVLRLMDEREERVLERKLSKLTLQVDKLTLEGITMAELEKKERGADMTLLLLRGWTNV